MLLKEFFLSLTKSIDQLNDQDENLDKLFSVNYNDVRKTPRLTLKLINQLRKQNEKKKIEMEEELSLIKKMYVIPAETPTV
jgi:hypothetical protein